MPSKLGYKLGGRHSFPKLENPAEEREKNPTMTGASFSISLNKSKRANDSRGMMAPGKLLALMELADVFVW